VKTSQSGIWAVIPVKEIGSAKQRLSPGVPPHLREGLVLAMIEDVLSSVAQTPELAGVAVVTLDAAAGALAQRYGARVLTGDARSGHTAAVAAAARQLDAEGICGMLQIPGDVPLVTSQEISQVLSLHKSAPSFTIVPSHDDFGSNTIVVSPPTAVPLTFGDDSFFPHLETAKRYGIDPQVVRLPGIGRDIDNIDDLRVFAGVDSSTRTRAFLDRNRFQDWSEAALPEEQEIR
jgi:2-phospho-L-lactate guanylyltransferase